MLIRDQFTPASGVDIFLRLMAEISVEYAPPLNISSPLSKSKKSVNMSWERELLAQMEAERMIEGNDFHDNNESPAEGEGGYIEEESWCNGSLYDRRIEGDFNVWNEGHRLSRDGIQSSYAGSLIRGPGSSFIRNKDNTVIRGPDIRRKPSAGLNVTADKSEFITLDCCVHYLCITGWVYMFHVGHIDKIMKPFSML
jgi:hypothetical protein